MVLSGPSFTSLLLREVGREGQDTKLWNESHGVCAYVSLPHRYPVQKCFLLWSVQYFLFFSLFFSLQGSFSVFPFQNIS